MDPLAMPVGRESLPRAAILTLDRYQIFLAELGFEPVGGYLQADSEIPAYLRHYSNECADVCAELRYHRPGPMDRLAHRGPITITFMSMFADGVMLLTTNARRSDPARFTHPRTVFRCLAGLAPSDLHSEHIGAVNGYALTHGVSTLRPVAGLVQASLDESSL